MTLIFDNGDLWVETIIADHGTIPLATNSIVNTNLKRPGRIVSISEALFHNGNQTLIPQVRGIATGIIAYGNEETQIQSLVRNNGSASATNVFHYLTIWLRK